MIIKKEELLEYSSLVGHIILHSAASTPEIIDEIKEAGEVDVVLTANGKEMDLKSFIIHWQSQVECMIRSTAIELCNDKFDPIRQAMQEFEHTIRYEIKDAD